MPEKQWTDWIEYLHARTRIMIDTTTGDMRRFLVQLEYRSEGKWGPVVRFDHNPEGTYGHDITEEGLYMDIYRDGEKVRVKDDFPPVALSRAADYCMSYIEANADQLLRRFEKWHNIGPRH